MKNIKLTREQLTSILKDELLYSTSSVKFIISGRAKPNYEVMLKLSKEHGVPFEAWQNIREFLGLPPTKTQLKKANNEIL